MYTMFPKKRHRPQYTLCPKKRPCFYFSNNSVKKLTDFNDFGVLNPEKI